MDLDDLESDAKALEALAWRVREAVALKLQDVEWDRESVDRIGDIGNLLCVVMDHMAFCRTIIEGPASSGSDDEQCGCRG